jgi:hypothetical protein
MEQMHVATIEFKEARELADAASIFQDLGLVLNVLARLRDLLKEENPDHIAVQSYWTTALVTYVRCFTTGKRVELSQSIFEGICGREQPAVDVHRHYKALRDKHIAHSVNPFEQVEIGAVLSPPGVQNRKVEGIATLGMHLISLDAEGVDSLHELARIARQKTALECQRLQKATQGIAETLDLDELYEAATIRTTAPAPEQAALPRG